MQTKRRGSLRWILLAVVSAMPLLAQGDRGEITGTVKDASGAVVPGAQITVVQRSTNASYKTTTSTAGDYTVPNLAGRRLSSESRLFRASRSFIADNVVVSPGGETRVDVNLEVGTAQQSIEVIRHTRRRYKRRTPGWPRTYRACWWIHCRSR